MLVVGLEGVLLVIIGQKDVSVIGQRGMILMDRWR